VSVVKSDPFSVDGWMEMLDVRSSIAEKLYIFQVDAQAIEKLIENFVKF
jgi:hypothetical protein